jgi:hypothetical protein
MNAGGCIRIAAGRKVLFSFQEDTILFYHKILTMKTAFDIGHTVAVNYKARKENDKLNVWMPEGFSLAREFSLLIEDSVNRYRRRMNSPFAWVPGPGSKEGRQLLMQGDETLTISEEREQGEDMHMASMMMLEFTTQRHGQDDDWLRMPGVPWKKFGRVVAYMRAALGPSSEQLTRWDQQERKPFEKKVPKKEEVTEPVVESPPTSPVRGRSRKRSESAGPVKAAVEPPPAASRSRSVGAGKKPARGKKPAETQTPEQAAEAAAAVARAAKLAAYRDPASAAARAAADAAAERVRDAVLATRKALDAQIWAMKASRDAEEEAVLHPTRAKKQAASAAAEQVKQLEAEVAAAQQEEAEAVAASTVEDVVPEPVEPPAEPPAEPAAEPAAPAVVDLAGEEPEAGGGVPAPPGGGVPAPPVEPAQVAPPAAATEPAAQVQAAAGPSAAPRRQTRSGRAGVVVPIKKTSTKARAKRAVTLPMPEAFIPTPMGITQPAPTPIITSVAPSVPSIPVSAPIIQPAASVPAVSVPAAEPSPMQVEPPQVPLAQPMDISPTQAVPTQVLPSNMHNRY